MYTIGADVMVVSGPLAGAEGRVEGMNAVWLEVRTRDGLVNVRAADTRLQLVVEPFPAK